MFTCPHVDDYEYAWCMLYMWSQECGDRTSKHIDEHVYLHTCSYYIINETQGLLSLCSPQWILVMSSLLMYCTHTYICNLNRKKNGQIYVCTSICVVCYNIQMHDISYNILLFIEKLPLSCEWSMLCLDAD